MTTIYVSTTGNDSTGTGTIGNPYLTIGKAVSVVTTGGVINVRGGTYTLSAQVSCSSLTNVTIASYPGELAIVDGGGTVDPLFSVVTCTGCTIQGLQLQHGKLAGGFYGAIQLATCQNINVIANYITNCYNGIWLGSPSG
jgi:hypothetical protein